MQNNTNIEISNNKSTNYNQNDANVAVEELLLESQITRMIRIKVKNATFYRDSSEHNRSVMIALPYNFINYNI